MNDRMNPGTKNKDEQFLPLASQSRKQAVRMLNDPLVLVEDCARLSVRLSVCLCDLPLPLFFPKTLAGFGISTTFWDHPFNTVIPKERF